MLNKRQHSFSNLSEFIGLLCNFRNFNAANRCRFAALTRHWRETDFVRTFRLKLLLQTSPPSELLRTISNIEFCRFRNSNSNSNCVHCTPPDFATSFTANARVPERSSLRELIRANIINEIFIIRISNL